ncbi:MAG: AAA family ATPase, partial [Planctomycetes bacterium]|nr:AAA family ATPase [Planctomycetota bacterium]
MRITRIAVEEFGLWKQLELSFPPEGLAVLYGPNEAGKTTLKRFLEQMLFGLSAEAMGPTEFLPGEGWSAAPSRQAGRLELECEGELWRVHRAADGQGGEVVVLERAGDPTSEDEFRRCVLRDVNARFFGRVFSIGLSELQELATLGDDELAARLYSASLGPDGERLLQILSLAQRDRSALTGGPEQPGRLRQLLQQDEQLGRELIERDLQFDRYQQLWQERRRLEAQIADLRQRQDGMQSQLRGHEFLQRVWGPWRRLQAYEKELSELTVVTEFPPNGLARLDTIDAELKAVREQWQAVREQIGRLREEGKSRRREAGLLRQRPRLQALLDQRDELAGLQHRLADWQNKAETARRELDQAVAELGEGWSADRVTAIDVSPEAAFRLVDAAWRYQRAGVRRSLFRRRYERLVRLVHRWERKRDAELQRLNAVPLDEAMERARKQLASVYELARLKLHEDQLRHRFVSVEQQLGQFEQQLRLPRWVTAVFGVLGVAGLALGAAGLWAGSWSSGAIGFAYALAGLTCVSVGWALRRHFSGGIEKVIQQLRDEQFQLDLQLRQTQRAAEALAIDEAVSPRREEGLEETGREKQPSDEVGEPVTLFNGFVYGAAEEVVGSVRTAIERLAELEKLAARQQQIDRLRRRLTHMRQHFQTIQRDFSRARQDWCEALRSVGLEETLDLKHAFTTWQKVQKAQDAARREEVAEAQWHTGQERWDAFRRRVQHTLQQVAPEMASDDPLESLAAWEERLRAAATARAEARQLREQLREQRKQRKRLQRKFRELSSQRSALLVQGGASSREEFEHRELCYRRRQELAGLIEQTRAELEEAARSEPELAVVEEDLQTFDPAQNEQQIAMLRQELDDLGRDLLRASEELGRLKHQTAEMEADSQAADLVLRRSMLREELTEATSRWLGLELASECFERMRIEFEKENQPA